MASKKEMSPPPFELDDGGDEVVDLAVAEAVGLKRAVLEEGEVVGLGIMALLEGEAVSLKVGLTEGLAALFLVGEKVGVADFLVGWISGDFGGGT